jgi:hypothetical protein
MYVQVATDSNRVEPMYTESNGVQQDFLEAEAFEPKGTLVAGGGCQVLPARGRRHSHNRAYLCNTCTAVASALGLSLAASPLVQQRASSRTHV